MMSAKKILGLIIFVLFVAGSVLCISSCDDSQPGGLRFVDRGQAGQSEPNGLVVVTHGWIEKGGGDWPENMAVAISNRVDSNDWLCGYFDWHKGAETINPTKAAKYARDVAGPKLAKEIQYCPVISRIMIIGYSLIAL